MTYYEKNKHVRLNYQKKIVEEVQYANIKNKSQNVKSVEVVKYANIKRKGHVV